MLDLTRLVSRAGRYLTGIDRVERAYLDALLDTSVPLFGLVRTSLGYVLLDQDGCAELGQMLDSDEWGQIDLLGRLNRRLSPERAAAEATLRRICVGRARPMRLSRLLVNHLPAGTHYLNVGHTNLTDRVVFAVRQIQGSQIAVLMHDTIPADYPEYQRDGTVDRFRGFLRQVSDCADLVICTSACVKADVLRHFEKFGTAPKTAVAHLGVPKPDISGAAPDGPWRDAPYFMVIGTIEPRKNHALLLDVWERISDAPDAPHLVIAGQRGWNNSAVFDRLDAGPKHIHELNSLDDDAMFSLLNGSRGLLFPSLAEGYGLPLLEAAALNITTICSELPVFWELLGDIPVYASVTDSYLWQRKIMELAKNSSEHRGKSEQVEPFTPPTWQAHFKTVLTMI